VGLTSRDSAPSLDSCTLLNIDGLKNKLVSTHAKIGFGVSDGSFNGFIHWLGGAFLDEFKIDQSLGWSQFAHSIGNKTELPGTSADELLYAFHSLGLCECAFNDLAVTSKGASRRKFTQFVTNHCLANKDFFEDFAIVNKESMADKLWRNGTGACPSFDRRFDARILSFKHFA